MGCQCTGSVRRSSVSASCGTPLTKVSGLARSTSPADVGVTTQPTSTFGEETHVPVSAVVSTTRKRAWLASIRW